LEGNQSQRPYSDGGNALKGFFEHVQTYTLRGLLAIIPLLLCFFALRLLYVLIDQKILAFLSRYFEIRQIPGLGILLLLACLYLIGLIASNIIGNQLLVLLDRISQRIPIIKSIYSIGKQVARSFGISDGKGHTFKKAILVRLEKDGLLVPALVMNSKVDRSTGEELLYVLIPNSPTPAGGFVCLVKASQTMDPGWTVEECLKLVLSAGIIIPDKLPKH
jgi:uncharacterized membrane protein